MHLHNNALSQGFAKVCNQKKLTYMSVRWVYTLGGGGDSYMKGVGKLVISHRGVNVRFWSQLGCFGQKHHHVAVKVSFRVVHKEI